MAQEINMQFETTIRVRDSEIDGQQVVHNSRYLEYAQAIATEYWAWSGIAEPCGADWQRIRVHIRRAEIDYILPFRRGDTIVAHAGIERIENSSLTNRFELRDLVAGQLRTVIMLTSVNIEPSDGTPAPIAPRLKEFFAGFLDRQRTAAMEGRQSSKDR
jgi:acyl-CoA thioester hydrolase